MNWTKTLEEKQEKCKNSDPGSPANLSLVAGLVHREIVPPRETVAIARVTIAIVGRGG